MRTDTEKWLTYLIAKFIMKQQMLKEIGDLNGIEQRPFGRGSSDK